MAILNKKQKQKNTWQYNPQPEESLLVCITAVAQVVLLAGLTHGGYSSPPTGARFPPGFSGNMDAENIQVSGSVMCNVLWPHGLQHARLPCPSPTPRDCSKSCPLSQQCHPTISSSVVPFSSRLQSFPASGSFLRSSSHQVAKVLELQFQHQSENIRPVEVHLIGFLSNSFPQSLVWSAPALPVSLFSLRYLPSLLINLNHWLIQP